MKNKNKAQHAKPIRTQRQFDRVVQEVIKTFFPRWRTAKEWKFVWGTDEPEAGSSGKCVYRTKTIWISSPDLLIIIHEICHAIADGGHAKKWCTRMIAAADTAEGAGSGELAEWIRDEVEMYEETPRFTKAIVYRSVEDAIYESKHDFSYPDMTRYICNSWGLSLWDLTMRYKQLPRVYDAAVRRRIRGNKLRQDFLDITPQ